MRLFKSNKTLRDEVPLREWVDTPSFNKELTELINKYSLEGGSNTPDFVLAQYLCECLGAFNRATVARNKHASEPMVTSKQTLNKPSEDK